MRPLLHLPDPPHLAPEPPGGPTLLDSIGTLRIRLLKAAWVPAIVLLVLWELLACCFLLGSGPTFWFLSLLVEATDPGYLRMAALAFGFTDTVLAVLFLVVPLIGTAGSVALLMPGASLVARLRPRRFLSEQGFQRAFSTVLVAALLAPALVAVALVVLLVVVGAPIPWKALAPGPMSSIAAGLLWIMLAWVILGRWMTASRLLGVRSVPDLERAAAIGPHEQRHAAALQVLAQDRRHLPPNLETTDPRAVLRAGALTLWSWRTWVLPAGFGAAWVLFGIYDTVVLFERVLSDAMMPTLTSGQPWQVYALGLPLLVLLFGALAVGPMFAMRIARPLRGQERDQRTYRHWSDRKRVNPWEERVVSVNGWLSVGLTLTILGVFIVALVISGGMTAFGWTWIVVAGLLLVPLIGGAGSSALRHGLRDVVYGPAGGYMRREVPYASIVPVTAGPTPPVPPTGTPEPSPEKISEDMIARGELPDLGIR